MPVFMTATYPVSLYVNDVAVAPADQMLVGPSPELEAYLVPYGTTGESISDCMSDTFNIRAGATGSGGPYAW